MLSKGEIKKVRREVLFLEYCIKESVCIIKTSNLKYKESHLNLTLALG